MNHLVKSNPVELPDRPQNLAECIIYGGLDGRVFSYKPNENKMFYSILDVKRDISSGVKLMVYENPIIDQIDFEAEYKPNMELPLQKHLNDILEKEFLAEMIHKHVHIEGPGFGMGFGVIVPGRGKKGHAHAEQIFHELQQKHPLKIKF